MKLRTTVLAHISIRTFNGLFSVSVVTIMRCRKCRYCLFNATEIFVDVRMFSGLIGSKGVRVWV